MELYYTKIVCSNRDINPDWINVYMSEQSWIPVTKINSEQVRLTEIENRALSELLTSFKLESRRRK